MSARSLFSEAKKFFNSGRGIDDFRSGFKLLQRAAALGNVGAHAWLGAVYEYGLGTRPNRRLAFKHYSFAAAAGNPNAEYHVAVFYHEGMGVPKDDRMAVRWLRKAVAHGDSTAVYWLGHCYLHGRGVPLNEKKGFELALKVPARTLTSSRRTRPPTTGKPNTRPSQTALAPSIVIASHIRFLLRWA